MSEQMIITVLAWAALGLGGVVLALLTWFALRIVAQLDHMADLLGRQHHDFKQEMAKQREDFKNEMHDHDLRIARIEGWRDTGAIRPPREPNKPQ